MTDFAFWFVQIPGWLLFLYLVIAQCIPAFSYQIGVRMGTQEPAENITEVGVAFFKGLAQVLLVRSCKPIGRHWYSVLHSA